MIFTPLPYSHNEAQRKLWLVGFKMATHLGNPRAASFRIQSDTEKGYAGQRKHDLRIGHQPRYVDVDRSQFNRILIEPPAPSIMRRIAQEHRSRRETKRAMKSNAAISTAGIITFGSEAAMMFETLAPDQQDKAIRLLSRSVAMRLRTPLHGLVIHNDEATIHAHVTFSSYTRDGVPISKATRPAVMSELQDLTARVMQRFCSGIERGNRYGDRLAAGADFADVIHKSVTELHRTLPADLAVKRAALAELADDEATAQARFDEMQARVEKLEGQEELTAKEVKRLSTYEKRLADRLGDLRAAQAASEAAKAEADRLADLARVDHDEMRRKVERSKLASFRIKADAEARAKQMVRGAELAADDIRDELAQDRAQLTSDRVELSAEFMRKAQELDAREAEISHKAVMLERVTGIVRKAVDYLGDKLGLGRADEMRDAVDQLEETLDALIAPESGADPLDKSGPGL